MASAKHDDRAETDDCPSGVMQAKTWGDLMAVAAQYQSFEPTIEEIERLQADERVRLQCEARERSMIHERVTKELLAKQAAQLKEKDAQLEEQAVQLETKDAQLEEKTAQIEQLKAQLARLNSTK